MSINTLEESKRVCDAGALGFLSGRSVAEAQSGQKESGCCHSCT